jgi:tRNA(Ile2) C34 agmatinyltransferase TiaS
MDAAPRLVVRAVVRVERGTAETCACGGALIALDGGGHRCRDCEREYA